MELSRRLISQIVYGIEFVLVKVLLIVRDVQL